MQNFKIWKQIGNFFGIRAINDFGVYNAFKFKIPKVGPVIRQEQVEDVEDICQNPFQNIIQVNIFDTIKVYTKKEFSLPKNRKKLE